MAATYLQLEGKTGRIYQYSKTQKEGFDEHESSTGNVTYRKYFNTGLYGILQNVSIRDSKIGEQVQISVKNGSEYINLQFPLYTQSGNIDNRYTESLIRFLPNLKKGQGYRFYPYAMEQEDSSYMKYGMSVITSPNPEAEEKGEKVEAFLQYNKEGVGENVIPNLVWKEIAGKKKPSAVSLESKDEFLYNHLKSAVDGHLAYEKNSSSSSNDSPKTDNSNSTSANQTESPKEDMDDSGDDYDDLPF